MDPDQYRIRIQEGKMTHKIERKNLVLEIGRRRVESIAFAKNHASVLGCMLERDISLFACQGSLFQIHF